MIPITPDEAEARNLRPLINPCDASESWIIAAVLAPGGLEIWRAASGWLTTKKEAA